MRACMQALATLLVAATLACGTGPAETPQVDPAYAASLDEWHARRVASLTAPDGWTTVVGLYWLADGDNGFGTAPDNRVRLPESAGVAHAGTLVLAEGTVTAHAAPGVPLQLDGEPVTEAVLATDAGGEAGRLTLGPITFYTIRRGDEVAVRVKDPNSEARRTFSGVERFPADPKYRVEASFEAYDPPRETEVPTVIGVPTSYLVPGVVRFVIDGVACSLEPLVESLDDEHLFFIFADATSGKQTYGAGRFLYTERERDGKVTLDFNRAFNPPCVFTPYATCPLPPPGNVLEVAIRAGELKYGGH